MIVEGLGGFHSAPALVVARDYFQNISRTLTQLDWGDEKGTYIPISF